MELYERVRYLRKEILKKTQAQFAKDLGTSRDAINNIEGDRLKRPDQKEPLLKLMCEKYNISERWLLTGKGEMQAKVSRQEEITRFVTETMGDANKTDTQRILTALMDATPDEIAAIANFARRIAGQVPGLRYISETTLENNNAQEHFLPAYSERSHNLPLSEPISIPGADGPIEIGFPDPENNP